MICSTDTWSPVVLRVQIGNLGALSPITATTDEVAILVSQILATRYVRTYLVTTVTVGIATASPSSYEKTNHDENRAFGFPIISEISPGLSLLPLTRLHYVVGSRRLF